MKKFYTLLVVIFLLSLGSFTSCQKMDLGPEQTDIPPVGAPTDLAWVTKENLLNIKSAGVEITKLRDEWGNYYSYKSEEWFLVYARRFYGSNENGESILSTQLYPLYLREQTYKDMRSYMLDKNFAKVTLYIGPIFDGSLREQIGGMTF